MSLLLESEAQFKSRAKEVGLSDQVIDDLVHANAGTLSKLAFCVGQPGQPIASQDVDTFLQGALGRPPVIAENNAVRRLAFEDQTLLVASLRQIVDQKEEGAPKRIGTVERETRMAAIRVELAGIMISDENEPSHALLEKACQIFETNTLRYLEPAVCTSRSQEVQGGTKTKELAFEGGSLIVKDKDDKLVAPTSSELQFLNAMTRRGVSMKFARLMTFEQHTMWTSFLLQALQREPPPGYSKPGLHQLMLSDKAAFTKLASTMSSVRSKDDGSSQLGERLLELRSDPLITLHLAPGTFGQTCDCTAFKSACSSLCTTSTRFPISGWERKRERRQKGQEASFAQSLAQQVASYGKWRPTLLCLQHWWVRWGKRWRTSCKRMALLCRAKVFATPFAEQPCQKEFVTVFKRLGRLFVESALHD